MKNVIPVIVTHPCALIREGLRKILTSTRFRLLHIASELDEVTEGHLSSAESCIWLMGVERFDASTDDLLSQVVSTTPGVKPIILSASLSPDDVMPALRAGACGVLCQDIAFHQLIKALELVILGVTVVRGQWNQMVPVQLNGQHASCQPRYAQGPTPAPASNDLVIKPERSSENSSEYLAKEIAGGLSRRETLILQALMEGASNKVIARQLAITEATVKVHMKAILRKLRLRNRTQAAMWARDHVDEACLGKSAPSPPEISRSFTHC